MPDIATTDNGIMVLLQNHRAGDCMSEISEKLRELTKAVHATGKKGKLNIQFTVAPLTKGRGLAVSITDKIECKKPEIEPDMGIFYVRDDGGLSRNDPRQKELPFETIDGGAQTEKLAAAKVV